HDQDPFRLRSRLELATHLEAAHLRQHDVEEGNIRLKGLDQPEPGSPVVRDPHLMPRLNQVEFNHVAEIDFIFDDNDARHELPFLPSRTRPDAPWPKRWAFPTRPGICIVRTDPGKPCAAAPRNPWRNRGM